MPSPKETVRHRRRAKQVRRQKFLRARNVRARSAVRTSVRRAEAAIDAGDVEAAGSEILRAQSQLDAAARKGLIHRRRAARNVSRLVRRLRAVEAG